MTRNTPLNILITGASSDIGFCIVKSLLEKQCNVVGQYHSNPKQLSHINNSNLHLIKANLSEFNEAEMLVNCFYCFLVIDGKSRSFNRFVYDIGWRVGASLNMTK